MDSNSKPGQRNPAPTRSEQLSQEKDQVINYANLYLPEDQRKMFFDLKQAGRIGAWWNKKIVIYTAKGKDGNKVRRPVIEGVLTVESTGLTFAEGMKVTCNYLTKDGNNEKVVLSHVPKKIKGVEIFMWVPHFSELHWVQEQTPEHKESNRLKFGLAFKARSDWTWFNRNNAFAMDLKQFKQTFPDFADVVL